MNAIYIKFFGVLEEEWVDETERIKEFIKIYGGKESVISFYNNGGYMLVFR